MRSPIRRLVTALWACWFLLLVSEPALLHACPMHDAVAPTAISATVAGDYADGHADDPHAGHAAHAGTARAEGSPDGHGVPHEQGHACSCLGDCATSAPVLRVEPQRWGWLAGVVRLERTPDGGTLTRPARVDLALPFANGPPTTTRA